MSFSNEANQRELKDAIRAIEAVSSVEVVVAIRPRLRRWPSANAAIGVLFALAMLSFELYSEDFEFDYWAILLLPLLAGMLGGILVELVPPLQRALTPPRVRARELRDAAYAASVELGIHRTRGRTGLLVFVTLRDRAAKLVGDLAVIDKLGQPALDQLAASIAAAIPDGGSAVARVLRDAAPAFAKALPRTADDIDELPNLVHASPPRRRSDATGASARETSRRRSRRLEASARETRRRRSRRSEVSGVGARETNGRGSRFSR